MICGRLYRATKRFVWILGLSPTRNYFGGANSCIRLITISLIRKDRPLRDHLGLSRVTSSRYESDTRAKSSLLIGKPTREPEAFRLNE